MILILIYERLPLKEHTLSSKEHDTGHGMAYPPHMNPAPSALHVRTGRGLGITERLPRIRWALERALEPSKRMGR